jgi:hypothetical protein
MDKDEQTINLYKQMQEVNRKIHAQKQDLDRSKKLLLPGGVFQHSRNSVPVTLEDHLWSNAVSQSVHNTLERHQSKRSRRNPLRHFSPNSKL